MQSKLNGKYEPLEKTTAIVRWYLPCEEMREEAENNVELLIRIKI